MSNGIFECECGRKTREPFRWKGQMLCAVCMEDVAPHVVESRARRNYAAFSNSESPRSRWNRLEKL